MNICETLLQVIEVQAHWVAGYGRQLLLIQLATNADADKTNISFFVDTEII